MRLKIQLSYNNFTVPMSYQSILQGVIYSLLSKDELGDFYHNDGYHYDKKTFKCFTFSQLFGKYKIENKHLIFDDDFYFYISSLDEKFLKHLYKTILLNFLYFCYHHLMKYKINNNFLLSYHITIAHRLFHDHND